MNRLLCIFTFLLLTANTLVAASSCVSAVEASADQLHEWEGSGLTLDVFERWLKALPKERYTTPIVIYGALAKLLREQSQPLVMVPRGKGADFEITGTPVHTVGEVELYAFEPKTISLRALHFHWEELTDEHPAWDFWPLWQWIRKDVTTVYSEADLALAINEGLKQKSPHDRLERRAAAGARHGISPETARGLGLVFLVSNDTPVVWRLAANGPAHRSGLQPGDEILAVNGVSSIDFDVQQMSNSVKEREPGAATVLTVRRGEKTFMVSLHHEPLPADDKVQWEVLDYRGSSIGLLTLQSFNCVSIERDVARALDRLRENKVKGLILDLRDNLGGKVEVLQTIAGYFLGKQRELQFARDLYTNEPQPPLMSRSAQRLNVPIIALVNVFTASAAEALAGILQHYKAAYLVGTQTYGKGTIQSGRADDPEVDAFQGLPIDLYSTHSIYSFPSGHSPQFFGLPPDIEITLPAFSSMEWHHFGERANPNAFFTPDSRLQLVKDPLRERLKAAALTAPVTTNSDPQLNAGLAALSAWIGE